MKNVLETAGVPARLHGREIVAVAGLALLLGVAGGLGWWLIGPVTLVPLFCLGLAAAALVTFETYRRTQRQLFGLEQRCLQTEGLLAVYSCLDLKAPFPPLREYSLSPDLAHLLMLTILQQKPRTVVEFGSGNSTLLSAYCLQQLGSGRVVSFDHEERFARATGDLLRQHGLAEYARVVHAPLAPLDIGGKTWSWYESSRLAELDTVDLVFVDGPPGYLGPRMRYPALPMLYPRLAADAVIVLDDASRPDEQAILAAWVQEYPDLKSEWVATSKGTAILRRCPAVPA